MRKPVDPRRPPGGAVGTVPGGPGHPSPEVPEALVSALDGLVDPVCIALPAPGPGLDFEVTYCNAAALVWTAQTGVGWVGRDDPQGARLAPGYADVWAGGPPLLLDDVRIDTTPRPRHVDLRAVRVSHGLLVTWRDVTARHDAESALAESRARFRMAFDHAPVGMFVAGLGEDGVGRYLEVNGAFADLLGCPQSDLVGRECSWAVDPEDLAADGDTGLLPGGPHQHGRELRIRRADGTWVWVRLAASAVTPDDGRPGYVIAHVEDVTARRAAEAELARRALYDPLTGLANRTLLLDHLTMAVRELGREPGSLAVLYLDLDRFKDVNDTLGHDAGDAVIGQIGARLSARVRSPDTASRLAGDEFVVAARVHDDVHAARIAERLHAVLSAPMTVKGRQVVVRASVGVTTTSDPQARPEDLLREADLAMYQAKRHRRRPWALYDAALHRLALERLAVEERLRGALAGARLRLEYQPIIDLTTGRLVSAEALLRVADPERGLLLPEAFIDVAEDSDLIVPIGEWVLEESCRALAGWQRRRPDMQVSVNVSARQVSHLVVVDQVRRATREAGVDPRSVQVEITERVLVEAGEDAGAELRQLAEDGCGLAIDDFGTGYSSLAYLKRFPVTAVKIDRSFVGGLGRLGEDRAIVAAVAGLAHTLDLVAVAEGVESGEQLETLRRLGCHRAQGFHIGRPLPPSAMARLVAG